MIESRDFGSQREREWEAQERALHEERLGIETNVGDTRTDQYRLLVRALRDPRLAPIPDHFAAQTAARAEGRYVADDRLEAWLQNGLLVLFAVVGAWMIAMIVKVADITPELTSHPAVSWGVIVLVCLALSEALEYWYRRSTSTRR